jgi:hypothetical protein
VFASECRKVQLTAGMPALLFLWMESPRRLSHAAQPLA